MVSALLVGAAIYVGGANKLDKCKLVPILLRIYVCLGAGELPLVAGYLLLMSMVMPMVLMLMVMHVLFCYNKQLIFMH